MAYGAIGPLNVPAAIQLPDDVHNWNSCDGDNAWNLAIKPLRTTRERVLSEKEKQNRECRRRDKKNQWTEEERQRIATGKRSRQEPTFALPRLTNTEKAEINGKLRPYTMIDYLYRLRITTNYEDSNMFTDGPDDNDSSRQVRDYLCKIASGSLLLYELAVMNLVGVDGFLGWANQWVSENLPENAGGLKKRLKLF